MIYCNNCQRNLAQDKFDLHFGYCKRNIIKCSECGIPYDKNIEDEHIEEYHKKQNCDICQQQFNKVEYDAHRSRVCQKRREKCEYCGLDVPKEHFEQHVRHCQSRTQQCQICRKGVANKHLIAHIANCNGVIQQKENIKQEQQLNRYADYPNYSRRLNSFDEFFGTSMNPETIFNQFRNSSFGFPNFMQKKISRFGPQIMPQTENKLYNDKEDPELQAALLASLQMNSNLNSRKNKTRNFRY